MASGTSSCGRLASSTSALSAGRRSPETLLPPRSLIARGGQILHANTGAPIRSLCATDGGPDLVAIGDLSWGLPSVVASMGSCMLWTTPSQTANQLASQPQHIQGPNKFPRVLSERNKHILETWSPIYSLPHSPLDVACGISPNLLLSYCITSGKLGADFSEHHHTWPTPT